MIPYMVKYLIISSVVSIEDDDILVYIKEYQWEWLKNMLESNARDDIIIETLDASLVTRAQVQSPLRVPSYPYYCEHRAHSVVPTHCILNGRSSRNIRLPHYSKMPL